MSCRIYWVERSTLFCLCIGLGLCAIGVEKVGLAPFFLSHKKGGASLAFFHEKPCRKQTKNKSERSCRTKGGGLRLAFFMLCLWLVWAWPECRKKRESVPFWSLCQLPFRAISRSCWPPTTAATNPRKPCKNHHHKQQHTYRHAE